MQPTPTHTLFVMAFAFVLANLIAVGDEDSARKGKRELLEKEAAAGKSDAMVQLGELLRDADDPKFEEALAWFHKAAKLSNARAMERIGGMYRDGYGVKQSYDDALSWYRKASEAGDATAYSSLGWMHFHGLGMKRNTDEALKYYRKSAELGSHEGLNNLGYMYQHGHGVKRDINLAIKYLKESAANGNPWAYENLGEIHQNGDGVEPNVAVAKEMFTKSAEMGHATAMIQLGRLLRTEGGASNRSAAFRWFRTADRHVEGMREVGDCYFDGIGVPSDAVEGFRWYERAIEAGHPSAIIDLANRLIKGNGIKADPERARKLLQNAADKGSPAAHLKLGHIASESGEDATALKHYRIASEKGISMATLCIAIHYKEGRGVKRDEQEAQVWLRRAAEQGNSMAIQIINQK